MLDGFNFWKNVDDNNPFKSASALAEAAGINYRHMIQQRADSTIPKAEDLMKLSMAMHKTIEFLLTGEQNFIYPPRIERIAEACMRANDVDLSLVERVLRLEKKASIQVS